MFDFERYLTLKLFDDIVSEFSWPQPYSLEDDLPDGIILSFPNSNFAFCEGPEGILVRFLPENTKGFSGLHLGHAMLVAVPLPQRLDSPIVPVLVNTVGLPPSEMKTKDEIRNACRIILARLTHVINGDFSWVDTYLTVYGKP